MRIKKSKFQLTLDEMGEFLAKFSEHSEQVYWISSHDFSKIQYVSPSYEKVWGRSREELYESPDKWINYFHPDDLIKYSPLEKMADEIKRYGEKARYSFNYRILRPDGEVRWIKDSGFPLIDNKGVCYGVTGVAIDVTEEYKQAEALKIARDSAEKANSAKDEFIRNMSHDIRTPLSGIIGMSSILESEATTQQAKEHAHMLNISSEQLLTLLNSVLDIIAMGSQKENQVNISPVKVKELIHNLTDLELPTVKLKKLDLKITLDDNLPELIESDGIKIHRILLNLFGNAVKFTENGYIEVGAKFIPNKKIQRIEFYIRDTGPGIKEEDQDKIFKKFFKGTSSSQGIYAGHGVGLHIVKRYIQLLKGKITVESKLHEGTTFKVSIPVKVLGQASSKPSPSPVLTHTTTSIIGNTSTDSSINILLIEDNAIALKTAENLLSQMDIGFQSASNGTKAIELFKQHQFDLVLSDIGLPDMSGFDIARQFRGIEQKSEKIPTPIIGLTAHSVLETEHDALASGMNQVISKPFRLEYIQELLKKYSINVSGRTNPINAKPDRPTNQSDYFDIAQFALLDVDLAVSQCGKLESLRELLEMLIQSELAKDLEKIQLAYKQKNRVEIENLAHKIKGGAVYIGTTRMKFACQYLESYLKSGKSEFFERLYHQAVEVINDTTSHITQWLKQP